MTFSSGLLLAAGASRRFGAAKLLEPIGGEPLVHVVARAFVEAGLDEIVVVLGARAENLLPALGDLPVRTIVNACWEQGMFSSIQAGLRILDPRSQRVAISPADLPLLLAGTVRRVVEAAAGGDGETIVVPSSGGRRGHPIVLPAARVRVVLAWPASSRLDAVLQAPFTVRHLEGFGAEVLHDVDVPSDLVRLRG